MSKNIIRDGYTRKGRIDGRHTGHDSIDFEYRPLMATETANLDSKLTGRDGARDVRLIAGVLSGKVTSWSECKDDGTPEPVTADSLAKMPFPLLNAMHRIVAGIIPSDPVGDDMDEVGEDEEALIKSLLEGTNPSEDDRKN